MTDAPLLVSFFAVQTKKRNDKEATIKLRLGRDFFTTPIGIAALVVTGGVLLWVLLAILQPLPGRDLTIATGPPGSAYAQFADRYREILARDGVRLRLVPTLGAIENLDRLRDAKSGVDVGFVQAGTTNQTESPELESLGSVFYEPLWIFCRCKNLSEVLLERPGARTSIGPVGSATRPLATRLLALSGIDINKLQALDYPPDKAANELIEGRIDIVVTLSAWESAPVQKLLRAPGVELIGTRRASAFIAIDPNFNRLTLPEGVVDLSTNRPPADVPLIASKASLVVRSDLHPALQYLLLHAALEVHSRPSIFQRAGEFPAPETIDLPLSIEAQHLYKSGPSILQRTLPFWLAELVQRLAVVLLPIVGILYPLWSLLPKAYRWQMQRRVNRLYVELRHLESAVGKCKTPEDRAHAVTRIENLEHRVLDLKVPKSFGEMSFNLRMHVRALLARVRDGEHS